MHYFLSIDQGTTNSRAIIFDQLGQFISQHEIPLQQSYPQIGWVEQDGMEMLNNTLICCKQALVKAKLEARQILAVGIANQRETTLMWHRETGKPIYPAIVWQDRRTAPLCQALSNAINQMIQTKTGLLLDPYFSATKIVWLLENIPHAREQALRGELLFGTVDTFLIWHLTKGQHHVTDATNASRTLLFNIHTQTWDEELLAAFNIPKNLLANVLDNTAHFGEIAPSFLGSAIPIAGVAGDQQAAAIGQACFTSGMVKATYGTGCFMLLNTGSQVITSTNQLITTTAYRIAQQPTYGLEGSIFCAGTTIKWLRDKLKLIQQAAETEHLAQEVESTDGVYLIPAFTGLGAPYWQPHARGAIVGLTANSSRAQIVRAALESVAYQSLDLLTAMQADSHMSLLTLRVDGGMTANQWLLQFLANLLNLNVQRPICIETSALGVMYLASLQMGIYNSLEDIAAMWQLKQSFTPQMADEQRDHLYAGWLRAIKQVCLVT